MTAMPPAAALAPSDLLARLKEIVGGGHVLTGDASTRRYRSGFRYGGGDVLAVVRPGSLTQLWHTLKACHAAGTVILCQAANTGLTGGSTPMEGGYDRPVVLINMLRLKQLDLLQRGEQVLAQPGVTLEQLERRLKPLGREPHSVIGSSCIGASVTGGICNNSGGSLIRRGPAFTQFSLFACIDEDGQLRLVNHLGMALGDDPEQILANLESGRFARDDLPAEPGRMASDREYSQHVRDIDSSEPARYNADPRRLYEASGSAGKIAVFAVRLDTFAADTDTRVFYIGTNQPRDLADLRRHMLARFASLPVAAEYMHRSAYDLSRTYGKDLFVYIRKLGTARVPLAFALKSRFDALAERCGLGRNLADRLLQRLANRMPEHLPARMNAFRDRYAHHLLLKVSDAGIEETRAYLQTFMAERPEAGFFECNEEEAGAAFLNRFAVGNATNRYRAVHADTVEDVVALDIALPRNALDWFEILPPELAAQVEQPMYCGHFFCHVMHQEYLVKKGVDCAQFKERVLALLDARGAKYPAEHNVGHIYRANPVLEGFYRSLDPTNTFNPGIGQTSTRYRWRAVCCDEHREPPGR